MGLRAPSCCSLNDPRKASGLTGARPTLLRSFTRQGGATLALVALALQLALSFGHLHARDISASGFVFAKASTADGWQRPAGAEVSKQSPSKLADDEDLCPICFSGFLLSTSFVPDAPQPPVTFAFESIDHHFARTIALVAAIRRTPFQPRAPPLA
jgi:Protein of unknown function (DUF2946)